jgi:hypothetical protein
MKAFGCPKKRWLKTPKARGCNNTLRLLSERAYGRLSGLMYQLIGMRAIIKDVDSIKYSKGVKYENVQRIHAG